MKIDCTKPENYTYAGLEILNIFKSPIDDSHYFLVVDEGDRSYIYPTEVDVTEIKEKPKFTLEVGKWYEFSDDEDFPCPHIDKLIGIDEHEVDAGYGWPYETTISEYKYCRPIPKHIYDNMVVEE